MEKELRENILKEAIVIGDQLLELAKKDENGLHWETMTIDPESNVSWKESEGIYNGVSGVVLFFLELHKVTGNPKYMETAREGMRWVVAYSQNNDTKYYALFTGRMGVPYTLLKMAEATGEDHWKKLALEIARPCAQFLESPQLINDLINGSSGTLLGLLHLHAATGENWILDTIDSFTKHLLEKAHHGPKGLYWDRSAQGINGLCGFSHGAAGIGFVFLELAHYFRNDAYLKVAQQAFMYETHQFDEKLKNWPDLRKGIYLEKDEVEHRKAYLEKDMAFFTVGGDMNAWCHGAAGIGLSRLRACELFKDKPGKEYYNLYLQHAKTAIEKTTATDVERELELTLYILCHGRGGNAELFINAYQTLGDEKYLDLAAKVAELALTCKKKEGRYLPGFRDAVGSEDTSLFMGNAGIGYFYLRLLAPHDVPTILSPMVNFQISTDAINPDSLTGAPIQTITKLLLKKDFLRTQQMAEKCFPEQFRDYLSQSQLDIEKIPLKYSFIKFMAGMIPSLSESEQACISDVFILEEEKIKMDDAIVGHSYIKIRDKVFAGRAAELVKLDPDAFLKLELRLEPSVIISATDWDWTPANKEEWANNLQKEPDAFPLMLKPDPHGILENAISPMIYTILAEFEEGASVEKAMQETIDAFEDLTPSEVAMLKEKIVEQVKQLLQAAILIE
ncbi:MAG: hypothetical protein GY757_34115 [bacterium]|nr:hypothetical protein [bacterium]